MDFSQAASGGGTLKGSPWNFLQVTCLRIIFLVKLLPLGIQYVLGPYLGKCFLHAVVEDVFVALLHNKPGDKVTLGK